MKKKVQVHLLPTDKGKRGTFICKKEFQDDSYYIDHNNPIGHLATFHADNFAIGNYQPNHVYFTSNEKIKNGDWCLYHNKFGALLICKAKDTKNGRVYQEPNEDYGNPDGGITPLEDEISKIVATANPEVYFKQSSDIKCNLCCKDIKLCQPAKIGDDFIEAYIKANNEGNPIKEVMLEYTYCIECKDCEDLERILTPRLRPNGTVIISPVKEKMYSRKEVEKALGQYGAACVMAAVNKETIPYYTKWFNKHYPE